MSDYACRECGSVLDRREGPLGVSYQCLDWGCGSTYAPDEVVEQLTKTTPTEPPAADGLRERLLETAHAISQYEPQFSDIGELLVEAAAALSLSTGEAWQTIETAPEEENVLIVVEDMVGEARFRRTGDRDDGWWWAGEGPGDYHAEKIDVAPTHWMPLPEPPRAALTGEDG